NGGGSLGKSPNRNPHRKPRVRIRRSDSRRRWHQTSLTLSLEHEQVRHCGTPLLILETVKFLTVYPIAIRFVWFKLHFQHASLLVGFVSRLADRFRNRILPSR